MVCSRCPLNTGGGVHVDVPTKECEADAGLFAACVLLKRGPPFVPAGINAFFTISQ